MTAIPSPCPCCGAYSLAPDTQTVTLVAVCDVLVVKALERIGNQILRSPGRSRGDWIDEPRHLIHTVRPAPDEFVARALRGAWDVVPVLLDAHGCCGVLGEDVVRVLDAYVHDLVVTGTAHSLDGPGGLTYRFESQLGLSLPEPAHG